MQIQAKPWEKSLVDDSLGGDTKQLLKKAEENEALYCRSLPKPGEVYMWGTFSYYKWTGVTV